MTPARRNGLQLTLLSLVLIGIGITHRDSALVALAGIGAWSLVLGIWLGVSRPQ